MNRWSACVATAVLGGFLATAAVAQRSERAVAVAPAPHGAARWEYATLRFKLMSGKWEWLSAQEAMVAEKLDLLRALGGTHRPDARDVSYIDIANAVGAQGWEVHTLIERDTGTEMLFKRPVR